MSNVSIDIEQIVRVVMQRLAAAGDLMSGVEKITGPEDSASELVVTDRLITVNSIEARLSGKKRVRVSPRAVVTPAVVDLLRERKIELLRDSKKSSKPDTMEHLQSIITNGTANVKTVVSSSSKAPILVCGSALWFPSLNRHLCPKQARAEACNDSAAALCVQTHLASGGKHAIWLTDRPYAACINASKLGHDTPLVHLPSLRELNEALEQARPRLLVVDSTRWTVAAIGNLVRALLRGAK